MIDLFVSDYVDELEDVAGNFVALIDLRIKGDMVVHFDSFRYTHDLRRISGAEIYNHYVDLAQVSGKRFGIQLRSLKAA